MHTRTHTRPEHAIIITIAVLFASVLLTGLTSTPASAALKTWVGAQGGIRSFNLASNWSGGTLPTASDSCVISLGGTTLSTITVTTNITIGALNVVSTSTGGVSLYADSTLTINGSFTLKPAGALVIVPKPVP